MIDDIFSKDGYLSRKLKGYQPREGQIAMARAVQGEHRSQILEAGTGIGKTFAYLAPIIQNGMKAVVSTGTRALQNQLFEHDIPFLSEVLGRQVTSAMLKGRSNYLCLRNTAKPEESASVLFPREISDWKKVLAFANRPPENWNGDIGAIRDVPESSPALKAAVSTSETCPKSACKYYDQCFLYKARSRVHRADIVIVNHHLFLSDLQLRRKGKLDTEIIPSCDIMVFDEAHLLPNAAVSCFGETVSLGGMTRMLKGFDEDLARLGAPPDVTALFGQWKAAKDLLIEHSLNFRLKMPARDVLDNAEWFEAAIDLAVAIERARGSAARYAESLPEESRERMSAVAASAEKEKDTLIRWMELAKGEAGYEKQNEDLGDEEDGPDRGMSWACWLEKGDRPQSLTLRAAPLSCSEIFQKTWKEKESRVVMTSATLSVDGNFDVFQSEVGMDDDGVFAKSWESPFDFKNRAMLYLPQGMPEPNDSEHTESAVKAFVPLARANGGRAFMLFSSKKALKEGAQLLRDILGKEEYTVIEQGDESPGSLLEQFRKTERAVLAGTRTFWQGVDVKGDALSLVAVDKIPFGSPGDPLFQARREWIEKNGGKAFFEYQLPEAIILMKQVAGRLMRDSGDWGVFMVCDPRLSPGIYKANYRNKILDSLPPMRHSSDEKAACEFLEKMRASEGKPATGDRS